MIRLATIPIIDCRDGGPIAHARAERAAALAVRAACLSFLPGPARALVPLADRLARHWLSRCETPYRRDIAAVADLIGAPGAYLLNTSYEWGCTTRAADHPRTGRPRLRRTLDWPFPGLGRHVQVARQRGPAGEFWNVTWPGAVGVLTALAPGRFAVALNQAPLHRRTRGRAARLLDHGRIALRTYARSRHMPPAHLLRWVVEHAPDAATAVRWLADRPVARPALFVVAGPESGETWLVERSETAARVFHRAVTVANDWQQPHPDWEPRGCSQIDRRAENMARRRLLADMDAEDGSDWVLPPVRNVRTRLAVEMDVADGRLLVTGYEPGGPNAVEPATRPLVIETARAVPG